MHRTTWSAGVVFTLMLWSEPAVGQTVEFTLDPPTGKDWSSQMELVLSISPDPAAQKPAYVHRELSTRRHRMVEEDGRRWIMVQVKQLSLMANGWPVTDRLREILTGHPIEIAIDDQGRFVDVRGLEASAASLRTLQGAETDWEALLRTRYATIWNATLGTLWETLSGRAEVAGSSWEDRRELQVLQFPRVLGRIPGRGEWRLLGRETPGQDSLAQLRYGYTAEPVVLSSPAVQEITTWLKERVPEVAERSWHAVHLSSNGELSIDPATLVELQWTDRKELRLVTADPAATPVVVVIELRVTMGR